MEPYKNLSGEEPISAFAIESSHIDVQYKDKAVYRYSHITPGREHVERMKDLARRGQGLGPYISANIYGYEPSVYGFQPKSGPTPRQ
jgi:hypothetical protein